MRHDGTSVPAGREVGRSQMNDPPPPPLPPPPSRDEVAALVHEYDKVVAEAAPKPKRTRAGYLVSVLAIFTLFAIPAANRALGLGISRRTVAFLALSLLGVAVIGVVVQMLGSALAARGAASQRALDALGHLTQQFSESSDAENRRAAVTLLADAHITGGATAVAAFDFADAKVRLGPALPYVQKIERVLREERQIYPVLTS